jgi:Putative DNA-binding domain
LSYIKHIFDKVSINDVGYREVKMLIDNQVEEFLHLDYEAIPPEKKISFEGLSQHISGFLNGSGGIVVFGLSEKDKELHKIPDDFTWTSLSKETLERNLYQKIDPWSEEIKIVPIAKPDDGTRRIFVILAPKSKNPPHMANYRYYMRVNFGNQIMGHDQVALLFRQNYLQKYDLINLVYSPLYSEITRYHSQNRIEKFTPESFDLILKDKLFLLSQDFDFYEIVDHFYYRLKKLNKAIDTVPFRITKIINDVAKKFNTDLPESPSRSQTSFVQLHIKADTTETLGPIENAILNDEDPLDFWKEEYPFAQIIEAELKLHTITEDKYGQDLLNTIEYEKAQQLIETFRQSVKKDQLVEYVQNETIALHSLAEQLMEDLEQRMK